MKLYHFSENPNIRQFTPRDGKVWAISEDKEVHYYFPRDCPRICYWITSDTTKQDKQQFFAFTNATKIISIKANWLEKMRETILYRYELPANMFTSMDQNAGYYIASQKIEPLQMKPIDHLLERIVLQNVAMHIQPSLHSLADAVICSSLGFSIIRLR
ncbi:hypothetical protein IC620_14195 [Hazenella sp. IB182357]|uniref:Uncharacterized protein n=1 Tax=Polycladospora coralii TaxID=2771432 RepID=A0A926RYG9_9BACL|nr:DUF6886 family protein [Polycladospora coralii]MBD1373501.1 hypothetical protein [Polycladospora coralii]